MSFFGFGKKHKENFVPNDEKNETISLQKELDTHKINLNKTVVKLSKTLGTNMDEHRARVVVCLDYSGSMNGRYCNKRRPLNISEMQETILKLLPIALKFDDDGHLESWIFSDKFYKFPDITLDNYETYSDNVLLAAGYPRGGTKYAPILWAVMDDALECGQKDPVFVLFITDGDNFDKQETKAVIRESSKHKIFIQAIGIGKGPFDFLETLDNLSGRDCDNTGFEKFDSLADTPDDVVYTKLLKQYMEWLRM